MGLLDKSKKKGTVSSLSSAMEFLEQASLKGPGGQAYVGFRGALCVAAVKLACLSKMTDSTSIGLAVRMLLSMLDPAKGKGGEEELLPQLAKYISTAMRQLLSLADPESAIVE
eukprot:5398434-Amphidinium_carterae.1